MNSNKFSYEHIFFAGKFYSFFATIGVLMSGFFEGLPLYHVKKLLQRLFELQQLYLKVPPVIYS